MPPQRTFDYEVAQRLYWEGLSIAEIGRRLGVSAGAVRRAAVPGELYRVAVAQQKRQSERAPCDRCGGWMSAVSRTRGSRVCVECSGALRASSVRESTLRCWSCRRWKADELFHRDRSALVRRGRASQCKACRRSSRLVVR